MNEALVEMFEYNGWATATLVDACRHAPGTLLDRELPGISGSVRSVLLHLVGGQQTQALRTQGRQHEGELTRSSLFPGFDELLRQAEQSGTVLIEIARRLEGNERVVIPWQGKGFEFPVRFFLTHALEHGVEHRTEIKVALGQMGFATPDLDGWNFAAARGYGTEV
ncbi:MAG: DinB family protein [bacterium]